MLRNGGRDWLRRGVADLAMAMALFWAVALFMDGNHGRAHAVAAPSIGAETILNAALTNPTSWHPAVTEQAASRQRDGDRSRQRALILLSIAFAATAALNLAFWRHLRRAYASPRRRAWRRG